VLLLDLTNHLDPQIKSEVFPSRVAKLPSKFALVSSSEHIDIQSGAYSQELHVLSIVICVASEFG
jgi:hypothetical protein